MNLTHEQIITYLALPGIGRKKAITIAMQASSPLDTIEDMTLHVNSLIQKGLISSKTMFSIDDLTKAKRKATRIIQDSESLGIKIVTVFDEEFPTNLKCIVNEKGNDDSPIILYYKGDIKTLKGKAVAIIGTREPSLEGIMAGEFFAAQFAREGFNVVSGLASGCDAAAHRGALAVGGQTTAFLAHGLDTIFPKENEGLAQQILDNGGLLISEYPVGTRSMASLFVERDRLQSGLSDATLVIQTNVKGGTMHAVKASVYNNKPVFAVRYKDPHNIPAACIQGNEKLITDGIAQSMTTASFPSQVNRIESCARLI